MRRGIAIALLVLVAAACEPAVETLVPVGEARIDCQGVPPQQCQQAVNDARSSSAVPLVELIVRCSAPPCTLQQGETQVQARYADGSTSTWGTGWSGAVPAPLPVDPAGPLPAVPLPVQPVCLGMPAQLCLEQASSAMTSLPPGSPAVRSITVRCTVVCTPIKGAGETDVTFVDGTSLGSGWGYETTGG
jgi:hypothetical protein